MAKMGRPGVAHALLVAGADKESRNNTGSTPLNEAAFMGRAGVAQALLKAGADQESRTNAGTTPLHVAAWQGHSSVSGALLEAGADKERRDGASRTPLHIAARQGSTGTTLALPEAEADKESRDNGGATPLHAAAWEGRTSVARALLDAGADKESRDNTGRTPLHAAAWHGRTSVARAPLDAGADKESRNLLNNRGDTPLHMAAKKGNAGAARALLDAGADKESRGDGADTPRLMVVRVGHASIARDLLQAGPDVESRESYGRGKTPLHVAAHNGQLPVPVIQALLKGGANTRAVTGRRKSTALHLACPLARPGCVEALLQGGADLEVPEKGERGGAPSEHGLERARRSPIHVVGLGDGALYLREGMDHSQDEAEERLGKGGVGGGGQGPGGEQVRARNRILRALRAEVAWRRQMVVVLLLLRLRARAAAGGPGGPGELVDELCRRFADLDAAAEGGTGSASAGVGGTDQRSLAPQSLPTSPGFAFHQEYGRRAAVGTLPVASPSAQRAACQP